MRTYARYVPPILVGRRTLADAGAARDSLNHSPYLGVSHRPPRAGCEKRRVGISEAELFLMNEPVGDRRHQWLEIGIVRSPVGVLDCRTTISLCAASTSRFSRLSASPPRIPVQSSSGTTMRSAGVVQAASNARTRRLSIDRCVPGRCAAVRSRRSGLTARGRTGPGTKRTHSVQRCCYEPCAGSAVDRSDPGIRDPTRPGSQARYLRDGQPPTDDHQAMR